MSDPGRKEGGFEEGISSAVCRPFCFSGGVFETASVYVGGHVLAGRWFPMNETEWG